MKRIIIFILMLSSISVWALSLDNARSKGLVEELPNGYLKVKDAKAAALVKDVNAKRKAAYMGIAKKSGAPVDQVAKQAAKKIKAKLSKK